MSGGSCTSVKWIAKFRSMRYTIHVQVNDFVESRNLLVEILYG